VELERPARLDARRRGVALRSRRVRVAPRRRSRQGVLGLDRVRGERARRQDQRRESNDATGTSPRS
jgi:hypothetical protein